MIKEFKYHQENIFWRKRRDNASVESI